MYDHGADIHVYNKEMMDYSSNINPLGIPSSFKKAILNGIEDFAKYPDYRYESLKIEIGDYLSVNKEHIQVGNGSVELIHKVIQYGFKKVVTLAPTFSEYEKGAVKAGIPLDIIPLIRYQEGNSHYFDVNEEKLLNHVEKDTLVIVCNPNNPTGSMLSHERLKRLMRGISEQGGYLLVDEAFIELSMHPEDSLIKMYRDYPHLIISRAATKFFGMPGIRLGYIVTTNKGLLKRLEDMLGPWQVNTAADLAKVIFKDDDYIKRTSSFVAKEIDECYKQLHQIDGLSVYRSNTIFHLVKLENKMDAYTLKERLINKGYLIRTPDGFKELNDKYFRIAIKNKTENINFMKVLEREVAR